MTLCLQNSAGSGTLLVCGGADWSSTGSLGTPACAPFSTFSVQNFEANKKTLFSPLHTNNSLCSLHQLRIATSSYALGCERDTRSSYKQGQSFFCISSPPNNVMIPYKTLEPLRLTRLVVRDHKCQNPDIPYPTEVQTCAISPWDLVLTSETSQSE